MSRLCQGPVELSWPKAPERPDPGPGRVFAGVMAARVPGMAHITGMADLLFEEIQASGEVKVTAAPIIDRQGRQRPPRC